MSPRPPRLPGRVLRALEGSDWSIQSGRRHWQIRIGGRLVAIWPYGSQTEFANATRQIVTDIKRARRHA